jgi:hypothetical protein
LRHLDSPLLGLSLPLSTLLLILLPLVCLDCFRCQSCCAVLTHCGPWGRPLRALLVVVGTAHVVASTPGCLMTTAILYGTRSENVCLNMHSSRSSLNPQPNAAGPLRHFVTLFLIPFQVHPTWDELQSNRMDNLYFMVLDPLANDAHSFRTYAGDCECNKDNTESLIVRMGKGFSTVEGTGFRCRNCNKCWWFHPLPCRRDNDPLSISAFLWDEEYRCRVPTSIWLRWLCSESVKRGNYFYQVEDANWRPISPPQVYAPPPGSCPGYTTPWPAGLLNFTFGL